MYKAQLLCALGFWMCVLTKYTSVYWTTLIDSLDKEKVLRRFKLTIGTVAVILPVLEYIWITPAEDTVIYALIRRVNSLQGRGLAVEKIKLITSMLVLGLLIILQIRIEINCAEDSFLARIWATIKVCCQHCHEPNGPDNVNSDDTDNEDSVWTIRSLLLICVFMIGPMFSKEIAIYWIVIFLLLNALAPSLDVFYNSGYFCC